MPEKLTKPNKLRHKRKHGFLGRSATHSGQNVIKRRRLKGRATI